MKKFIIKLAVIKLSILLTAILILSSCHSTKYGCPVNAQRGFGPGRMR
jgi:predicted small secreted protein